MTPIQHLAAIETEQDILSVMLCKPHMVIPKVRAELAVDDFYRESHKPIFTAMLDMYQEGESIDISTLVPRLEKMGELQRVGGITAISAIYSKTLGIGALDTYLEIVKDRARRRNAIRLMDVAIAQASDLTEDLDLHSFQTDLAKVAAERYVQERSIGDIAMDFIQQIGDRYEQNTDNFCVMTGLPNLDRLIHGLRKQELIYLAARPSMGKSALGIQIAVDAATAQKKSVMYVSLEMGERQIFSRAVANLTQIDSEIIMYDPALVTRKEEYTAVCETAEELKRSELHLRFKDVNTPQGIYNQAQQIEGRHGLDLIIIDHVHLMRTGMKNESDNLNANMKYISGELKQIAIEFDIPVLALAQLSRGVESRNDKRPLLSDLRDSGSLEQDADKVLMMYRESYYTHEEKDKDLVEVIVRKQRDGRLGVAYMDFFKPFALMIPTERPIEGVDEPKGFKVPE